MKININQILANNQTENQLPVLIRACNSLVMEKVRFLVLDISYGRERVNIMIVIIFFLIQKFKTQCNMWYQHPYYMVFCYFQNTYIFALEIVLMGKYIYKCYLKGKNIYKMIFPQGKYVFIGVNIYILKGNMYFQG